MDVKMFRIFRHIFSRGRGAAERFIDYSIEHSLHLLKYIERYALPILVILFFFSSSVILSRAVTPVNSGEDLEILLIKESANLGLRENVKIVISDEPGLSSVTEKGSGYEITLRRSFVSQNITSLRHELYHIYGNDIEEMKHGQGFEKDIDFMINEFKAEAYAVFGIKI